MCSTRSCGMNRSCATVLTLPLPFMPDVYQSSMMCSSDIGTSATTGYGSPSRPTRIAMIPCKGGGGPPRATRIRPPLAANQDRDYLLPVGVRRPADESPLAVDDDAAIGRDRHRARAQRPA